MIRPWEPWLIRGEEQKILFAPTVPSRRVPAVGRKPSDHQSSERSRRVFYILKLPTSKGRLKHCCASSSDHHCTPGSGQKRPECLASLAELGGGHPRPARASAAREGRSWQLRKSKVTTSPHLKAAYAAGFRHRPAGMRPLAPTVAFRNYCCYPRLGCNLRTAKHVPR